MYDPSKPGTSVSDGQSSRDDDNCEDDNAGPSRPMVSAPEGTLVFESRVSPELLCPICSDVLKKATSPTHCGHWFCEECLTEHLRINGGNCPICREKCEKNRKVVQHIPRSLISELRVYCRYGLMQSPEGEWVPGPCSPNYCPGIFKLDTLASHDKVCQFAVIECGFPGCGEKFLRSGLGEHEEKASLKHLRMAVEELKGLRSEVVELKELRKEVSELRATVAGRTRGTLDWSPGSRIVSCGTDHTVKIWRVADGVCERTLTGHDDAVNAVAVLPGNDRIVSASDDATLRLWDVASGECIRTFRSHQAGVMAVAVLPGGGRFISGSQDKTLKCWQANTGTIDVTMWGHFEIVNSIHVLPGGLRFVSASNDKVVKVWRVAGGSCEANMTGHGAPVFCAIYLPAGDFYVTGSAQHLKIWRKSNGVCEWTIPINSLCSCLAGYPEGNRFISGHEDGSVRLWFVGATECEARIFAHELRVTRIVVLPTGDRIASASRDGSIKIWRLSDQDWEGTLPEDGEPILGIAVL